MLEWLRIRGLGVIDDAEITLDPGLTVVTGETGAGKTMVLTGLGLLMGAKSDSGLVRTGASSADVDGSWALDASGSGSGETLERLADAGAQIEEDGGAVRILVAREVAAGGRSRAFAGGRAVPAGLLGDVTASLVTVHGQADQIQLRDARRQRELLDAYGGAGLAAVRDEFRTAFGQWRAAAADLAALLERRQERDRDAALLRHGLDEVAAVDPLPGEDADLRSRASVLAHSSELAETITAAHAVLVEVDDAGAGAADRLRDVVRRIEHAAARDESLTALRDRAVELVALADELAGDLERYVDALDADPQTLAALEERRQAISALTRRYGPTLDDVLAWRVEAEATISVADGAQGRIDELTAQLPDLRDATVAAAEALSGARRALGERFAAAVTSEVAALAMPDAEVSVIVTSTSEPEDFTADGADVIEILLRPHAGSEPRPIAKGASGGELSRLMLAIEVVLAGTNPVPTFVFDEVDAGIGGKVAVEVGRRLARLARSAQVVVVTHLPQVAAFADRHLVVTKGRDGAVTATSVAAVEGDARVAELVRMLSGLEGSASGAEHASELLALADAER